MQLRDVICRASFQLDAATLIRGLRMMACQWKWDALLQVWIGLRKPKKALTALLKFTSVLSVVAMSLSQSVVRDEWIRRNVITYLAIIDGGTDSMWNARK